MRKVGDNVQDKKQAKSLFFVLSLLSLLLFFFGIFFWYFGVFLLFFFFFLLSVRFRLFGFSSTEHTFSKNAFACLGGFLNGTHDFKIASQKFGAIGMTRVRIQTCNLLTQYDGEEGEGEAEGEGERERERERERSPTNKNKKVEPS